MEIELLLDEKLHKQFAIHYTRQDVDECIVKEAEEMQPEVKVNGFRPGKVPIGYIIRMYGEKIRIEAMNNRVTDDITDIIKKNNFDLAVHPVYKFRERQDIDDQSFYLDVDFYLFPEVPEKDFSQIELEKMLPDDGSMENIVDKNLLMLQIMTSNFDTKEEGGIVENDRVELTIDVVIEGEPAPGLGGDLQIIVGHEQIPAEVEKQVLGMTKGEVKVFEHIYPEDAKNIFFKGAAGKTVQFSVTINAVSSPQLEDLNEAKLKQMGFSDAEHLLSILDKNTRTALENMTHSRLSADVLNFIQENYNFEIPDFVIDQEAHTIAYSEASRLGNIDAVHEVTTGALRIEVSDEHREQARRRLVTSFVLTDYARKNNIIVEEWEVKREMENHLEELKRMNTVKPTQKEQNYQEFILRVRTLIFERKVVSAILKQVKIKETFLPKDEFFDKVKVA